MMTEKNFSSDPVKALSLNDEASLDALFNEAAAMRREHSGDKVETCSIVNARCGSCAQNCAFCSQSAHASTGVETYPLLSKKKLLEMAGHASRHAGKFGIVTSGTSVTGKELDQACEAICAICAETSIAPCASFGLMSAGDLKKLKNAGLKRYHHNLETARSFFPEICGTRDYQAQIDTIRAAQDVGLDVCSGGIFGLGESIEQRVELLETIRDLQVDSVPLNFLVPIIGTKLENQTPPSPMDCLKIIAVARLMMPDRTIRVCGGRERNLRDLQSWMFHCGASGLMIGGYLTTAGRPVEDDLNMIQDCGLIAV